jgi:hypothetical protein
MDKGKKTKCNQSNGKEYKSWGKGKENVKKIRIHVVKKPYTEYIKWEIELYKKVNIPLVGEEVYLLNHKNIHRLKLPKGDFFIFDQKRVISNIYNNKGYCLGARIFEQRKETKPFIDLRRKILNLPLEKIEI